MLLGFGVPHFNTFCWTCFLKGIIMNQRPESLIEGLTVRALGLYKRKNALEMTD